MAKTKYFLWVIVFLTFQFLSITSGQKLIRMIVPAYPVRGESVNLECQPEGVKQLKTIRWYKGNHEFFRSGSNHNKFSQNIKISGVNVDAPSSSANEVVLKNVSFATSGDYMCEITLTDKSVQIAFGHLRVIAPPLNPPEITGVPSWIRSGGRIVGNCTSYHSKPAAQLKIFVNDVQLETPHLTHHPAISTEDGEMETSIIGFHFESEPKYFLGGQMVLKCQSYVLRNLTGLTTKVVRDATAIVNPPELLMQVYSVNPVSIGDQIQGRCSFFYIEQPTSLTFYINGEQAVSQVRASETVNLKTGIKMTFVNFDFDVIPMYFLQTKHIHIACNATLGETMMSKHVVLNETPYIYQILKLMYTIKNSINTLYDL